MHDCFASGTPGTVADIQFSLESDSSGVAINAPLHNSWVRVSGLALAEAWNHPATVASGAKWRTCFATSARNWCRASQLPLLGLRRQLCEALCESVSFRFRSLGGFGAGLQKAITLQKLSYAVSHNHVGA